MPPRIEWALRAYAKAHPEEAHFIERVIKFREAVALNFERLVRDGVTEPLAMTRPALDCLASAGQTSRESVQR